VAADRGWVRPFPPLLTRVRSAGHPQAEFSGGALVCNETVAVRKGKTGLQLEGALSADYYRIRDLLYGQFAVV